MKTKKIISILAVLSILFLSINFISADLFIEDFEAGQNYSFTLNKVPDKYEITGNFTEGADDEINITWDGKEVLIQTSKYLPKGTYEINFYREKSISSCSGGGSSYYQIFVDNEEKETKEDKESEPKENKSDDNKKDKKDDKDDKKEKTLWELIKERIFSVYTLIALGIIFIIMFFAIKLGKIKEKFKLNREYLEDQTDFDKNKN